MPKVSFSVPRNVVEALGSEPGRLSSSIKECVTLLAGQAEKINTFTVVLSRASERLSEITGMLFERLLRIPEVDPGSDPVFYRELASLVRIAIAEAEIVSGVFFSIPLPAYRDEIATSLLSSSSSTVDSLNFLEESLGKNGVDPDVVRRAAWLAASAALTHIAVVTGYLLLASSCYSLFTGDTVPGALKLVKSILRFFLDSSSRSHL